MKKIKIVEGMKVQGTNDRFSIIKIDEGLKTVAFKRITNPSLLLPSEHCWDIQLFLDHFNSVPNRCKDSLLTWTSTFWTNLENKCK